MITTNKTQKQIAKEIEVSEKTICEWKKQKEFKDEIDKNIKESHTVLIVEGWAIVAKVKLPNSLVSIGFVGTNTQY